MPGVARPQPMLRLLGASGPQRRHGLIVEFDHSTTAVALRLRQLRMAVDAGETLADRKPSGREVHVRPPQSEHLAAAQAALAVMTTSSPSHAYGNETLRGVFQRLLETLPAQEC